MCESSVSETSGRLTHCCSRPGLLLYRATAYYRTQRGSNYILGARRQHLRWPSAIDLVRATNANAADVILSSAPVWRMSACTSPTQRRKSTHKGGGWLICGLHRDGGASRSATSWRRLSHCATNIGRFFCNMLADDGDKARWRRSWVGCSAPRSFYIIIIILRRAIGAGF